MEWLRCALHCNLWRKVVGMYVKEAANSLRLLHSPVTHCCKLHTLRDLLVGRYAQKWWLNYYALQPTGEAESRALHCEVTTALIGDIQAEPNATLISDSCTAISSVEDVVPRHVTFWLQ